MGGASQQIRYRMIHLKDFSIGFGTRTLLDKVNTSFGKGELTALIGRNGSGKSTLLRAIAGLNRQYSGDIILDGKDIRSLTPDRLARTLAFVTTERTRIPNLRCEDVVAIGRAPYTNWIGRMQDIDRHIVSDAIRSVGDGGLCRAYNGYHERRRMPAHYDRTGFGADTPVMLLDEPHLLPRYAQPL